ncbi:thiamine transporter [Anaerosporobacter mobilis DSM 15930]|jgi:thiamine transporter|uniref:Thiamine transporter n=1 Tax=Anaerosporobacter mobilis DSM 15930 TaxID=1120996 RepID=A0A1M7K2L6_9FIRM|nr:energy-coupled thiamine transporter ThiT [Anaerosporobacter mobilis]SHM59213.1 thiamine transporter [Anaerosporobacter mobilis DSM 15930]
MYLGIMNFFATGNTDDGYALKAPSYVLFVALVLALLAIVFLSKKESKKIQTKQLVFASVAMALAVVTSFIKFVNLPYGGSATLFSMFFICLIGYLYGTKIGLLTGVAYGFLQLIIDPSVYHPVQLLLDYPVAFGCLGLAGVFSKSRHGLIKGYILGVVGRYIVHAISGYIFFIQWFPAETNPVVYTLTYNASYIVPEALVTIIILLIPAFTNGLKEVKRMANE